MECKYLVIFKDLVIHTSRGWPWFPKLRKQFRLDMVNRRVLVRSLIEVSGKKVEFLVQWKKRLSISIGRQWNFPFNQKTSQLWKTGVNGTKLAWGRFWKFRKLWNFRYANHSTENSGQSRRKIRWEGNFPVNRNFGCTLRRYPPLPKMLFHSNSPL